VTVDPDGKIVAAGVAGLGGPNPRFALGRYFLDGSLDTSFNGDGKLTTDFSPYYDSARGVANRRRWEDRRHRDRQLEPQPEFRCGPVQLRRFGRHLVQ
jgi:hypothetical protein